MAEDHLSDGRVPQDEHLEDGGPVHSLADDLEALWIDGKTYAEAELSFQKSRFGYAAGQGRSGLAYGVLALAFAHLLLIGLVVGAILSLATLIGPLGATLIVCGVLLAGAIIFALSAKKRFASIGDAFAKDEE
ncbi:phage holin family protein [Qipengyuania sp. JC766]|uniref:phage holin family protein n=1 Tax=Qipengyuania sp. JC766 TaxID=3232139 RepID=UPI00345995E9